MERIDMQNFEDEYKIHDIYTVAPSKKKSELFKLVLVHFSEAKDFDQAILEWNIDSVSDNLSVHNSISDQGEASSMCICSHEIKQSYYVKNQVNNNILRIGSECINKFMSDNLKEQANILKKQMHYQKTGSQAYKMCGVCHRHNIPIESPSWKNTCKACFKKGDKAEAVINMNNRPCETCHQLRIPPTEPSWKLKCSTCYKANCRICTKCLKPTIQQNAPKWITMCSKCYN